MFTPPLRLHRPGRRREEADDAEHVGVQVQK